MIWRRPWRHRAAEAVAAPSLFSTWADLNREAQRCVINNHSLDTFTLFDKQVLLVWGLGRYELAPERCSAVAEERRGPKLSYSSVWTRLPSCFSSDVIKNEK